MILVLFYMWDDARVCAHQNHFFDMYLIHLGPENWFPLSSQAHCQWASLADDLLVGNVLCLLKG